MKQIVLILFLCIAGCSFVWGQDANYYRNPDRIYLDSKDEKATKLAAGLDDVFQTGLLKIRTVLDMERA